MEIQEIITKIQGTVGDKFDISQVTSMLKGMDLKNISFPDILSKLKSEA